VASGGGRTLEESGGPRQARVIAGEGMLVATADGSYTDEFGERQSIKAGITRVAPDHPLARRRPDAFRVAWRNDVETAKLHRGNQRARMKELRGGEQLSPAKPIARPTTARPAWWIE
jgi:hypothetical protein